MTTAAIRMGDGHVVHSCGDFEVEVPMGSRTIAHRFYVMDTEAFDFVLGTDFFVQHSQIQSLMLQAPYLLYVDHSNGRESVPLEQSKHTSSYLRVSMEEPSNMMAASKTEDYQPLGEVLDQSLKGFGYSREDLSVELFASDKQHVLDLYCSKPKNCGYKFYWPSFGMAYGNPRFSELGKVLTKVALERSRMVLCSPDWGAHGGNEYWRTLLDRLTISSVRLPDEAVYVPLGRKMPIGKPGWGSMLSVVDGGLISIPWEDLDSVLVQAIQRESDGLTLGDLKDRLRPQDAIRFGPPRSPVAILSPPCRLPVPFLALLAPCRSPVACLSLPCRSPVALLSLPCRFPVAFLPLSCRYPVASRRFPLFLVAMLLFPWRLPVALLSPSCRSFLSLSCCYFLSPPCRLPVASLSLPCRPMWYPVALLSLACRLPVACLPPSCRHPVAFLSPPCRFPVAQRGTLSLSRRLPVGGLSLACRLPVASLSPPCRLPVASLSPNVLTCRSPVACLSLACRLPIAFLLPPFCLPIASLSPPCHPTCYPVAPLLHCCGLPVPFLSAACCLPVASLSLSSRLLVAFLALLGARKKETLSLLRYFPFALCFTILWVLSISIIVVSSSLSLSQHAPTLK